MKIEIVKVGELETNCYLLDIDGEVVIIDPGDEFYKIKKAINNRKVVGLLITHFHFDHIGALEEILGYYNLEINKVNNPKFVYKTIDTPGHTMDSITFYFEKERIMFDGDFIFNRSIGRTDLGGSDKLMQESLEKISKYPDDIILYPGHGPKTILGEEKKYFKYYYWKVEKNDKNN